MKKKDKSQIFNCHFPISRPKVAIAMSGGVDSSTAAKILQKQGYECLGIFMRLGIERACCDEAAARQVCQKLGIKFYPLDLRAQFERDVKKYFLEAYQNGLTPNPCVKCNQFIKFGALLEKAKSLGCEYLATGHYLKLKKVKGIARLYRAKDKTKDQTYFLYNLSQKDLAHIIFPLGDSLKAKIKAAAKTNKLPFLKAESQDVCFLPGAHNDYLKKFLKLIPGKIKTLDGKIVGEHQGLPLYTIGQRKGVEIGGAGPYYVVRRDFKTNTLYVATDANDPALSGKNLIANQVNWISGHEPKMPFRCAAVIRYRHSEVSCLVLPLAKGVGGIPSREGWTAASAGRGVSEGIVKGKYKVIFSEPQRAITPGQSVVFYKKDELLGGGTIVS